MTFNLDAAPALLAKKLNIALTTVVQKLVVDIHTGVTQRTPVDTGRARASWMIAIGEPSEATAPPMGQPTGKNKGQAVAPGEPKAPAPSAAILNAIDGTRPVWISNNLPYAEPLENGHSSQAPAGMVAITLAEVAAQVKNVTEQ